MERKKRKKGKHFRYWKNLIIFPISKTPQEKVKEEGWKITKKLSVTAPSLVPSGMPCRLKVKSSVEICFKVMFPENVQTYMLSLTNDKLVDSRNQVRILFLNALVLIQIVFSRRFSTVFRSFVSSKCGIYQEKENSFFQGNYLRHSIFNWKRQLVLYSWCFK